MPMYVGGYFLTFAIVRKLMNTLEIDDRGVEEFRLEWPINNWLAERGSFNLLAGAIVHPVTGTPGTEDGILLMTQFFSTIQTNPVLREQDRDIRVREWLLNEVGIEPHEMEWMCLWDNCDLTLNGIAPRRNEVRGPRTNVQDRSKYTLTYEHLERWKASGKRLEEFLEDEAKEGRWPLK